MENGQLGGSHGNKPRSKGSMNSKQSGNRDPNESTATLQLSANNKDTNNKPLSETERPLPQVSAAFDERSAGIDAILTAKNQNYQHNNNRNDNNARQSTT